jgi:hypothetical protein
METRLVDFFDDKFQKPLDDNKLIDSCTLCKNQIIVLDCKINGIWLAEKEQSGVIHQEPDPRATQW